MRKNESKLKGNTMIQKFVSAVNYSSEQLNRFKSLEEWLKSKNINTPEEQISFYEEVVSDNTPLVEEFYEIFDEEDLLMFFDKQGYFSWGELKDGMYFGKAFMNTEGSYLLGYIFNNKIRQDIMVKDTNQVFCFVDNEDERFTEIYSNMNNSDFLIQHNLKPITLFIRDESKDI